MYKVLCRICTHTRSKGQATKWSKGRDEGVEERKKQKRKRQIGPWPEPAVGQASLEKVQGFGPQTCWAVGGGRGGCGRARARSRGGLAMDIGVSVSVSVSVGVGGGCGRECSFGCNLCCNLCCGFGFLAFWLFGSLALWLVPWKIEYPESCPRDERMRVKKNVEQKRKKRPAADWLLRTGAEDAEEGGDVSRKRTGMQAGGRRRREKMDSETDPKLHLQNCQNLLKRGRRKGGEMLTHTHCM